MRQAVVDWRKLTIQCVKAVDDPKGARTKTSLISERILDNLAPIIHEKDELTLYNNTKTDLDDLCLKAMHLALRMRQSRSVHQIIEIKEDRQLLTSNEHDLQIEGSLSEGLNENNLAQAKVAFQVSGALVSQELGVGKHVVLEKARVVVRL